MTIIRFVWRFNDCTVNRYTDLEIAPGGVGEAEIKERIAIKHSRREDAQYIHIIRMEKI